MQQTKSKQRVRDHGEVFTAEREVNAMLDLVAEEASRANTRFLEPTCGTGNFLVAILKRKLKTASALFPESPKRYKQNLLIALASLYGIDILPDNVAESRTRLIDTLKTEYARVTKEALSLDYCTLIQEIVAQNIICGDFLTAKTGTGKTIVVTEWDFTEEEQFSRREFRLDELLMAEKQTLFSQLWQDEPDNQVQTPKPIQVFPQISYCNFKPTTQGITP